MDVPPPGRLGGQRSPVGEESTHFSVFTDVRLGQSEPGVITVWGDICPLYLWVVEVVEFIDTEDMVSFVDQVVYKMAADEPGSTGDGDTA